MLVARETRVTRCSECPFASGLGDGEVMPSFVRCEAHDSKLIPDSPSAGCGNPPPTWCPLRKTTLAIEVSLDRTAPRTKRNG